MPANYSRPVLLSVRGIYTMPPNKLVLRLNSEALHTVKAIAALRILQKDGGLIAQEQTPYTTRVQVKYLSSQVLQTELCPAHTGWETSISSKRWLWRLSAGMKHELKLLVLTKNNPTKNKR